MTGLYLAAAMLAAHYGSGGEPQSDSGHRNILDGDTIKIHGERIRLYAIDAPESRQLCQSSDGSTYRCGQMPPFALVDMIGRTPARC